MFKRFVMAAVAALVLPCTILGQERAKVAVTFLPPPLETATYSLGIYDAKTHKLVRRLHEYAPASAFTAGLNGLITSWNGKDDDGKAVPPGRYSARGYAIGELKVEGKAILGNDWAGVDENLRIKRVLAITMLPNDAGLAILASTVDNGSLVATFTGNDGALRWQKKFPDDIPNAEHIKSDTPWLTVLDEALIAYDGKQVIGFKLTDGAQQPVQIGLQPPVAQSSSGKANTFWKIEEGVLAQYSSGERLRSLAPKDGEPLPVGVVASRTSDRLYLLEEAKDQQRVRGLSWKENTKEGEKSISTWTTFFENSITPGFVPVGSDKIELGTQTDIALVENPLSPSKTERLKLSAAFDAKGSYLATADGLRLRQISQRPNLRAVKLGKNKAANTLAFYQYDGAAWDEFSVEGAREMIGFDAGEIDLTATGEKPAPKATEPDL